MPLLRRKGLFESNKVLNLPVAVIAPNPDQPRRHFSREGLEELAASIKEHGVLQPLSVRRSSQGYELVSGERRLRASRMAGLTEVPCIVVSVDSKQSSLLALVENLQRRDLDFVEEASALARLIETYHLSQEEAARRIGKSQSAVAKPKKKPPFVIKDVRLFLTPVSRGLSLMKTAGVNANCQRKETEDSILLTITIPKA